MSLEYSAQYGVVRVVQVCVVTGGGEGDHTGSS